MMFDEAVDGFGDAGGRLGNDERETGLEKDFLVEW